MLRLFLILSLFFSAAANAVQVTGLYQSSAPVADRSQQVRLTALAEVFAQVLVKVSGRSDIVRAAGLQGKLKRATDYVLEYRYQSLSDSTANRDASEQIWAAFEPNAINRLLDERGVHRWSNSRPNVLLWFVDASQAEADLVAAGGGGLQLGVEAQANRRGLPVSLPLLDLEDRRKVRASDVRKGFYDTLLTASRRYASDLVAAGVVANAAGGGCVGNWALLDAEGLPQRWRSTGAVAGDCVRQGLDGLADRVAAQFTQPGRQEIAGGVKRMQVEGVFSLADFARLSRYLDALDVIQRHDIARVEPGRVWINIEPRGGRRAVEQAIALGDTLQLQDSLTDWRFLYRH